MLYFYPVRCSEYSDEAAQEFIVKVIPTMRRWLDSEMSTHDTQFQAKTLVIEWAGASHKSHILRRIA